MPAAPLPNRTAKFLSTPGAPMTYSCIRAAALTALTLISTAAARAESVLDHVPDDAIGFAVIRNLEATNAKIEGVTKLFAEVSPMPIPAPLPLLKAATGLGKGLNEQGDAVLAILPGEQGAATPRPLLIVAVSDYAAFAGSVNGDASGEVCRVTIGGEEILVAKRGAYAVLMNVEHRDRLDALLAAEPKPAESVAPLEKWLATVDIAAVLTPSGVDMLTALGQQGLASQRAQFEDRLAEPELADSLKQVQQSLRMYELLLGYLGAELDAVGVGLAIDEGSNVKLATQAVLSNPGELAGVAASGAGDAPLVGYADVPYVGVFGGPTPPAYGETLSVFMRNILEANPQSHGFEDLSEADWEELQQSWRDAMGGMKSMSMIVHPGDADDPLYSNVYGAMKVDDSKKYMATYVESMEKWNKLLAKSSSDIKLVYEISEVSVGGQQGITLTADLGEAASDPNVPMVKSMMEAMFGEDGKMRMYLVPVDAATVVMGITKNEEKLAAVMKTIAAGDTGLAKSAANESTTKLLDDEAAWIGLVSPKGTVAWITRFVNKLLAQFGQGVPAVPEFPETPPLGFSMRFGDGRISTEMVWPVEALRGTAEYIKKLQDAT